MVTMYPWSVTSQPLRAVTVAYNPGEELARWAHSMRQFEGVELVIVDNGTEPETVDAVAEAFDATVIRPGVNLGYGSAVNLALEEYVGEWALVVNPDVVLLPGCLDGLSESARLWPSGAAFGPRILEPTGETYPSARRFPRLVSGVGHAILSDIWPANPFTAAYRDTQDTGSVHPVDWLSGACLLVRMEAFREVGGFDDSYFMFFEDTQLGEDLKRAGWDSIYVPTVSIVHEQGASWRSKPERMLVAHHRSAAHYLDGVYDRPWQAPLRWALHAGLAARSAIQVRVARRR